MGFAVAKKLLFFLLSHILKINYELTKLIIKILKEYIQHKRFSQNYHPRVKENQIKKSTFFTQNFVVLFYHHFQPALNYSPYSAREYDKDYRRKLNMKIYLIV